MSENEGERAEGPQRSEFQAQWSPSVFRDTIAAISNKEPPFFGHAPCDKFVSQACPPGPVEQATSIKKRKIGTNRLITTFILFINALAFIPDYAP